MKMFTNDIYSIVFSKFEPIPDDLTPEEVLEQATTASQEASDRLTQKKPDCTVRLKIEFLC